MNTRVVSMRWIAVALLAGFAVWLAGGGVQVRALDGVGTAPALAPLVAHCEIGLSEESDPFSLVDEVAEECPDLAAEMRSVEFVGDTAWARVVVDGRTELQVFQNRDGVWERIPYTSGPSPEWEYLLMLEEETLGADAGALALAPEMGDGADPAAQLGLAAADIAADVRGETYWDQFFNDLGTTTAPSAASPIADEAGAIDLLEHEIDGASGSELNTVPDLVRSLFDDGWVTSIGNEDLSREGE